MKRIINILMILLVVLSPLNVFAQSTKVLKIVEKSSETKKLADNQGTISKSIIDIDEDKGEATIELKLVNSSKSTSGQVNSSDNYEIFIVIDNSGSMFSKISTGETRKEAVNSAAKKLINSILTNYSNVKIGIIKFGSGKVSSEKMCDLTNDITIIEKAIDAHSSASGGTNIDSGLKLASESFSNNNSNKIVVLLTDGAPTEKIDDDNSVGYLKVDEATKNRLIKLNDSGINIISMLTEIEDTTSAEYIFGTPEKPTVGKYYYIADSDINRIVSESIFSDISQIVSTSAIKNVKIVDYFPSEILTNFEFSLVSDPKVGTVSKTIDTDTNSITWNIDTVGANQNVSLKYKLKIKDINNDELVNKVIATNEKVILDYTDVNEQAQNVVLDSSPTIKLTLVENSVVDKPLEDSPQTGIKDYGILIGLSIILLLLINKVVKKKDSISNL